MKKLFYLLLITLGILGSCASSPDYVNYVAKPKEDLLLAHEPKDDLPLTATCEPDDHNKDKCRVLMTPEYFRLYQDLLTTQQRLKDCEAGK